MTLRYFELEWHSLYPSKSEKTLRESCSADNLVVSGAGGLRALSSMRLDQKSHLRFTQEQEEFIAIVIEKLKNEQQQRLRLEEQSILVAQEMGKTIERLEAKNTLLEDRLKKHNSKGESLHSNSSAALNELVIENASELPARRM